MEKEFRFRVVGDGLTGLEEIRRITDRKDLTEVIIDAFRTYEWVLQHQTYGWKVLAENGQPEEPIPELEIFVKNWDAAKAYFPVPPRYPD